MNRWALIGGSLLLATAIAGRVGAEAGVRTLDGYAARVNDRIITIQQVQMTAAQIDRRLRDEFTGAELELRLRDNYKAALANLIDQALILEEFKLAGGQIPDRYLKERSDGILRGQFRNDRLALQEALDTQKMTRDEWMEETRNSIALSMLKRQEIGSRVKINPIEVYRRYEARAADFKRPDRVRLTLLTVKSTDGTDAATRAAEARGKLLAGGKPEELASAYSSDSKASSAGNWGWMKPDDFRGELRDAIRAARTGEWAPVLVTSDAAYVFRVEEQRAAGLEAFEDVRGKLEDEVRREETERLFKAWIARLREKHYIEIF